MSRKLRVALVGCGQIADAHLQEINKIALAEIVGVCDRQVDLAEQAAARFDVPQAFDDLQRMIAEVQPDVLHIATPPHTHCGLAIDALKQGLHVYVEKPFTLDATEAEEIFEVARNVGRTVCVGHDQLFDPVWEACRARVKAGELGRIVHVDSIQGYDLSGPFGKAFASEPQHWVHRLPGGLFQNVMSHAMYRITDFVPDREPAIWATAFAPVSDAGTPTELRVMLRGQDVTAHLIFSSTIRPVQRVARIYGTKASLEVDLDGRTVRAFRKLTAPGPFAKIQAPARHCGEAARTLARHVLQFLRGDIHYFAGMNRLFTLFYQSILDNSTPPIPPREVCRVTGIMDRVFRAYQEETDKSRNQTGSDTRELIPAGLLT